MLLFIFLDGIGIGPATADNPFLRTSLPTLQALYGGRWLVGEGGLEQPHHLARTIDASLGIEGLPQSATGQTTLFTGINGPALEGMHISAFPTRALRETLAHHSFLKRAREAGRRVTFANAYSDHYWTSTTSLRNRHSATTLAAMAAEIPLRDFSDLINGDALYWDITHELARASYAPELPFIPAFAAGLRLARLANDYDLVLYETFLPDLAGHRRIPWSAHDVLRRIDEMLAGVLSVLADNVTLLITSDHGNLEDPHTKGHTYHPVPLIVKGPHAPFFQRVHDLTGVTPAILSSLAIPLHTL